MPTKRATRTVAEQPPVPLPSSTSLEVIDGEARQLPMRVERAPEIVLEEAHKAARALQDVVQSKSNKVMFNGEQYLELEDWQILARFYGLSSRVVSDKYIVYGDVTGFEATADVIRTDGAIVSSASAMCLSDEKNWKGKPLFQLRSMAQTRAAAKAFRLCLSWVAVLAGYRGTPAEEMDAVTRTVEAEPGPLTLDEAIQLTEDQKRMLRALGDTLEPKWLGGRYIRELNQAKAFLPVRDKLLGLHSEQCGPKCRHFTDAISQVEDPPA